MPTANVTPKRFPIENLTRFCVDALLRGGLDAGDARIVTDVLVMTDTWGTFSHGTGALRNYLKTIRSGGIDPHAKPEIVASGETWAIVDAHHGMGMPPCCLAVRAAIEIARGHAIAWVGVRNSSHFGAAGYYANLAASHDMVGIAMSNADPNMTVPGARGHVIGNNPLAYAVPAGEEDPILMDIAMSAVAASKIFSLKALGEAIPGHWITDDEGLPTESAADWPAKGSMLPMAAHKGYGIALLIEVLSGLLSGAGVLDAAKSWMLDPTQKAYLGQSFLVINVGKILPIMVFKRQVDEMIRKLRSAPKAKGAVRVCVPGELEWERRRDALAHGIPLPELVAGSLLGVAEDLGLDARILNG